MERKIIKKGSAEPFFINIFLQKIPPTAQPADLPANKL